MMPVHSWQQEPAAGVKEPGLHSGQQESSKQSMQRGISRKRCEVIVTPAYCELPQPAVSAAELHVFFR
jgi:hypothetical protein